MNAFNPNRENARNETAKARPKCGHTLKPPIRPAVQQGIDPQPQRQAPPCS